MTLYSELQKRGLLDLPNEDAANAIKAVTAMDIVVPNATTWMREELLWYWSAPNVMSGAIQIGIEQWHALSRSFLKHLASYGHRCFGQSATILTTHYDSTEIAGRIFAGFGTGWFLLVSQPQITDGRVLCVGRRFNVSEIALLLMCKRLKDLEAERIALEQAEHWNDNQRSSELTARIRTSPKAMPVLKQALFDGDKPALIVALRAYSGFIGAVNAALR